MNEWKALKSHFRQCKTTWQSRGLHCHTGPLNANVVDLPIESVEIHFWRIPVPAGVSDRMQWASIRHPESITVQNVCYDLG